MGLHRRTLHRSGGVEIRSVACRPEAPVPGEVERASNATLILPLAGVFRLHLGREDTFVADPTQAVFLPPDGPHRYSHPLAGGDDCLAIELPAAARRALAGHRERIEAVQLLLAGDPGRDWRLADLAREVASSPCHLTTVFRRATGVPVHRYLVRLRLARALDEVLDTDRELTAIGADLGFATPSHFAASFRRAYGVAPGGMRVETRKNSTAGREPRP